jgi:hypothetical protein
VGIETWDAPVYAGLSVADHLRLARVSWLAESTLMSVLVREGAEAVWCMT